MAPLISFSILVIASLLGFASAYDSANVFSVPFSYSGDNGPEKWGTLSSNFKNCSTGKKQSPVDIEKDDAKLNMKLEGLNKNYVSANATLVNNGFNIGLRFEENAGDLEINGKKYTLIQMHWHTPSEHRINGKQFPAELHIVHRAEDDSVAVVSVLYESGDSDSFLEKLGKYFRQLAGEKCGNNEQAEVAVGKFEPKPMKKDTRKYYRYIGSLTTPPCAENVVWTVIGKPRSISEEQVKLIQSPLSSDFRANSRAVQELNGRTIEVYDESKLD